MSEQIVVADKLGKRFDSKPALDSVSVAAGRGDIVGVIGKNGAGKTTLLEVLLGFSPPTSGSCSVFGVDSMKLNEADKSRIGYVPQKDELIEVLNGEQQIRIISSFHRNWDRELVDRLVAEWEIPLDRRIAKMSVGERQKLSVVLAFAHAPELIVLDEPVASLDPIARRNFLRHILDLADISRRCVVFSSHIVSDLERAANRIWMLKSGSVAWQGDTDALKESVVRLHIRAGHALADKLDRPGVLSSRVDGNHAEIAVTGWRDGDETDWAECCQARVEVERLGLEEIFVEMHR